jgi:3-hydroxyacyl-[acyl-carrier-protein] dehydratase
MRFNLIDEITELEPSRRIKAVKNLTLGEEYLADHFPGFPVMPGVLMLQTLVEAGAWLLRVSEEWKHSMIVLREAKNVKYGHFMEPGRQMQVTVEMTERNNKLANFKGKGEIEGQLTVSARITLETYNLQEQDPGLESTDQKLIAHFRELYRLLGRKLKPAGSGSNG